MSKATEMLAVENVVDSILEGMRRDLVEWLHTEAENQGDLMKALGNPKVTARFRLHAGGIGDTASLLSERVDTIYLPPEYP